VVYIAVDYKRPIDILSSLFDDEDDTSVEVSGEQGDKLDQLLSFFGEEEDDEEATENVHDPVQIPEDQPTETPEKMSYLEESFLRMREEKIQELEKRIRNQMTELAKYKVEKMNVENKISRAENDLKLLQSRIDSLKPKDVPNGYIFYVSEELNQKTSLPEDVEMIIRDRVSKIKNFF
jgi:hypothetical protein